MPTYVIGDIHGCFDEFQKLLGKIHYAPGADRLLAVGDLIGRGPQAGEVVRFFMENSLLSVQGNHERHLLQPEHINFIPAWAAATGLPWPKVYSWLKKMPFYIEEKDYIVVHAGLHPDGRHPRETDPFLLTMIRSWDRKGSSDFNNPENPAWFEVVRPLKTVIFGHWASHGLINLPKFKGLDSGCVYGGGLTCYHVEADRMISVPAAKRYYTNNEKKVQWPFQRGPSLAEEA